MPLFIQTDNFKGASSADSNQIGRDTLVGGVSYLVAENVGFEEIEYAVFGFQFDFFGRHGVFVLLRNSPLRS